MRVTRLFLCGLAVLPMASPALAQGDIKSVATPPMRTDNLEVVPLVSSGDQIGIACNALTQSGADSDVRVVLTISAEPGEAPPGYKKVLATEEEVGNGAVRVRIPTAPDLENHTVNVNVYVLGDKGQESCDAGHVRIVRQRSPSKSGTDG